MQVLSEVVGLYFSEEKILKSGQVILSDSWKSPLSWSKYWYITPLDMIETDKAFYFDRRRSYLKSTQFPWTIIGPLFIGGFALMLWLEVWHMTPQSFPLVVLAFVLGYLPAPLNKKINQGLGNIVILKKNWIKTDTVEKDERVLVGELPNGESYSLVYYLSPEQKDKLSFFDKYFGGAKLAGSAMEVDFKFTFRDAA